MLFSRYKTTNSLIKIENILKESLNTYIEGVEKEGMVAFVIFLCMMVGAAVYFVVVELRKVIVSYYLIKGYFQIVPRFIMDNMEIVGHLRDNEILDDLNSI